MDEPRIDRNPVTGPQRPSTERTSSAGAANTPLFGEGTTGGGPSRERIPDAGERSGIGSPRSPGGADRDPMGAIAPASQDRMGGSAGGGGGGNTEDRFREQAGEVRHRTENRINQTLDQAADGLETAARQLDDLVDRQAAGATGTKARAGRAAHSTADTMESIARYLRDSDAQSLQRDLEQQIRTNPIQTLLIGVAAGWITGKILR